MRLALLAGAAFAVPAAPVAASVTGFELPPSPTETAQPQGPVVEGVAPPRAAPTPTPTPRATTPAPSPTPTPAPTATTAPTPAPSTASPTPSPGATARPGTATPTPSPSASAGPAATATPEPTATPSEAARPAFETLSGDGPAATPAAPAAEASSEGGGLWPWIAGIAGIVALLGALGAAAWLFLRRREAGPVAVPEIERPRVVPRPAPPPPPVDEEAQEEEARGPLRLALEARRVSFTLTSATLDYRITLTNNGSVPLSGVEIAGDMVSAHASLSPDEQLASDASPLELRHEIERIKPGESVQVTGEFRLPFRSIRAIHKGTAALFVPLARFRVIAAEGGNGAIIQTALVGQRSTRPGGGLQPFRLDLGPRIYREVTQKIFS